METSYYKWLLNEKKLNTYNFPPNTENFFKIDGDFSNFRNWKAKVLLGNSKSENIKIGDYEEIRYLAVSLVDNTIIPIAASDEHQRGADLLTDYYQENNLINANDFYIVNTYGNHYIYYKEQIKTDLMIYKKLLSFGFKFDITINLKYNRSDYNYIVMSFDEFIKYKGDVNKLNKAVIDKGELSTYGKKLVDYLDELSLLIHNYHLNDKDFEIALNIKNKSKEFMKFILNSNVDYIFDINYKLVSNLKSDDISLIEKSIFTVDGIKNTIHNKIRVKDKKAVDFFINVDLALIEFNRIE